MAKKKKTDGEKIIDLLKEQNKLLEIQAKNSTIQLAIELRKNDLPIYYASQHCELLEIGVEAFSEQLQKIKPNKSRG